MSALAEASPNSNANANNNNNNSSNNESYHTPNPTIKVECQGSFPTPGSTLGPFFCLGRLGKGTFCSIHKCIDLDFYHHQRYHHLENTNTNINTANHNNHKQMRIVAAKVELEQYTDSGVLEGEGQVLSHLEAHVTPNTVPQFRGFYVATGASALVMEFLGGDDMHHLRDATGRRRMTIQDAVYLSAQVLLPLLKEMHLAGVVHRDVKPSNCVRRKDKEFAMVDFGLSKSIVVDTNHPEAGAYFTDTLRLRNERPQAEFRGTSMYASLRVHQGRDYSFRDDMWSLLYVFCDLLTGGLPWMSHAANRDRDACHQAKEEIHGDLNRNIHDKTEIMLMGEEYFLAKFKHDMAKKDGKEIMNELPEPLELSKDLQKVELLRKCFQHLASLGFNDMPDYDAIKNNLIAFLDNPPQEKTIVNPVVWKTKPEFSQTENSENARDNHLVPTWDFKHIEDPLDEELDTLWTEAESQVIPSTSIYGASTDAADLARLPLDVQFRFAQMMYHKEHCTTAPPQVALRDWMKCALYLLYGEWDSQKLERGNHRTNTDGYRRDLFLKLVEKCLECAQVFQNWTNPSLYFEHGTIQPTKKRKLSTGSNDMLVTVSRVMTFLRHAKKTESNKKPPPPPSLSQGYRA